MNRKIVLGIALIVMAMVMACAPQPNVEEDMAFEAKPIDGGKAAEITKYTGSKWAARIPPRIQELPVTRIGEEAFRDKSLVSVDIPGSVTFIGDSAFRGNSQLTGVTIPNNVTEIGNYAFAANQLTSITIGNSVSTIGGGAFAANQLAGVTIPNSVTEIGDYAFGENQLTGSVTIPASVTSIGAAPFITNPELTAINVSADNQNYSSIDGVLYNKDTSSLLQWPAGKTGTVTIPNSVTSIEREAFRGNQLTGVTIPISVTVIGWGAFYGNELTNAIIPISVTEIGDYAFYDNQLTSVTIPISVTRIGPAVFTNNQLTSVTIGADVTLTNNSFGNGFESTYSSYRRAAGTYTRPNTDSTRWTRQ